MKKILISILFIFITLISNATNYYVSNSGGSDSNDGKTTSTAWKTLSKVNNTIFSPGDIISLKKGDSWRETLKISTSGNATSNITINSYGSGSNPQILGSNTTTWSLSFGNVWVSDLTFSNPRASFTCDIYFIKTDGTVQNGIYQTSTSLTSEYQWTFSGNKIYVYAASDPDTRYKLIEIPQRQQCIDTHNREYIDINGLTLMFSEFQGISYDWSSPQIEMFNCIIENCEIANIGGEITVSGNETGYGIDVGYSNMTIKGCTIHNCGRRAISLHIYGSGFIIKNILIEQCTFYNGHHTTGPDLSVGSGGYSACIDGVTIRRNLIYDDPNSSGWSELIFLQNQSYSNSSIYIKNIYIYSNIFITPIGNSINIEATQGTYVYNNTFYGHNNSSSFRSQVWIDNNNSLVQVKNNIFYTLSTNDSGGTEFFVRQGQDLTKVDANYNLYYRINNSLRIIYTEAKGAFYMNDISLIRSQLGYELNSPIPADPKFTSSTDYHLQPGSPAIGKGVYLPVVAVDYDGKNFANPPSIGAYESGPTGINDIIMNNIKIFPNPVTNDNINISIEDNIFIPNKLEIIDMNGKNVYSSIIPNIGNSIYTIPFNLKSGFYLIRLFNKNNEYVTNKIIVL